MDQYEIGRWSQPLYDAWHAEPEGARKRRLLNDLMRVNEPLVKLLVDQFCGYGSSSSRKRAFRPMGGLDGFRDIPFEDAMQAGRLALQKALEQFDPSKRVDRHGNPRPYQPGEEFKISGYLRFKIRYELQQIVLSGERLIKAQRGDAPIPVALVGDEQIIDFLSGGEEDAGAEDSDDNLQSLWDARADERARAQAAAEAERRRVELEVARAKLRLDPDRPIESFLEKFVRVSPAARVTCFDLGYAYLLRARDSGLDAIAPRVLVSTVVARTNARRIRVRDPRDGAPLRGLAGVGLVTACA